MLRNYNGNVNRSIIRDLKKLCNVNAENSKKLLEALQQKGSVSFYTNLDFLGCPDELSGTVTLKSEAEINEYLKKDFVERLEGYLRYKRPSKDYLLSSLIEHLKENGGVYPDKDTLRQLELTAEATRISNLPSGTPAVASINPNQAILKEILELAEEIMEARRETTPDDITVRVEPYPESLWIESEYFYGNIIHEVYYGTKDSRDYHCTFGIKDDYQVYFIKFEYEYGGEITYTAKNVFNEEFHGNITKRIVAIHKELVRMAREMGIEFSDEVKNYEEIYIQS